MARGFFLAHEQYEDFTGIVPGVFRVPGALVRFDQVDAFRRQLYMTENYNQVQAILDDAYDVMFYRRKKDLPWKYLAHVIMVRRRNSAANGDSPQWKILARCDATDFIRVEEIVGGASQWRHYRAAGTAGRWRPNLERLRDVHDAYYFAGVPLTAPVGATRTGALDADTGDVDRDIDD